MINTTSWQPSEQSMYPSQHILHSSSGSTIGTITCAICDAGFTPAPARQDLLQVPPTVLEAMFMSMCHFCFRCRRPACPECWDAVHGVCGACVQEAHLPFRAQAAPLGGVIFPPQHQQHPPDQNSDNNAAPLLVCIRPGRFQAEVSLSTDPLKSVPVVPIKERPVAVVYEEHQAFAPPQQPPSQIAEQQNDEEVPVKARGLGFLKVVERVLNVLLLIILFAIVVLTVLAEFSLTANRYIIHLFHVDIRGEIAYLISVIRQLHW